MFTLAQQSPAARRHFGPMLPGGPDPQSTSPVRRIATRGRRALALPSVTLLLLGGCITANAGDAQAMSCALKGTQTFHACSDGSPGEQYDTFHP